MNTETENSIAEMKIFHCHYISGFLTTQRVDNGLCIQRHFEVISLYMRLLNRSVHKYKCLFYQTNAYQTSVIVRCARNKEVWLAHFVLWTLSSRAEMKNIFTAALRVPVCKPLPAAASHASVKVAFHRELIIEHFQAITRVGQWGKVMENGCLGFLSSKGHMNHY